MSWPTLSEDLADRVWDVLVAHGGADEGRRADFVHYAQTTGVQEWRFQGSFGMGGKVRASDRGRLVVKIDYYSEDHTPALDALQDEINARLEAVVEGREFDPLPELAPDGPRTRPSALAS